jgi:hypothetical protein
VQVSGRFSESTIVPLATATQHGRMSAADKARLDGLATITSVATPLTLVAGALDIQQASAALEGSMSAADKAILDLLAVKDYAIAYHNTTQSIASGSATAVALNTEQADGAGFHDNATNNSRLTVPAGKGGLYLVGGAIRFNTAAAGTRRYLGLRANGTTTLGEFEQPATASFPTCFGAVVVFLSATEYVEMLAFQDSGGAVNLINSTNAWPKFWLVRLSG